MRIVWLNSRRGIIATVAACLCGVAPAIASAQFVDCGPQVSATTIQGAVFQNDPSGRAVVYTVERGEPAHLLGYDVHTGSLLLNYPLPGNQGSWTATASSDHRVYMCGSNGHLYRYTAGDDHVEDLGRALPSETVMWDVDAGEDGTIYGATYPGCRVFSYRPDEGFKDVGHGSLVPGENYVRCLAFDRANGEIYAGVGSHAHLIELDPKTGEKRELLADRVRGEEAVYSMAIIPNAKTGDRLLAWVTNRNQTLIYNLKTQQVEQDLPTAAVKAATKSPVDERLFYVNNDELMSTNLDQPSKPPVQLTACVGFNGSCWQSSTELLILNRHGSLVDYDTITGKAHSTHLDLPPQPIPIQSAELGPDGKIWMGGFLAGGTASFDPTTGKTEHYSGMSQIERIGVLDGKMYFGVYPGARFYEFDPAKPWGAGNPRKFEQVHGQSRPIAMLGVPELSRLFIGTVPEYGFLGGHLMTYEPKTDKFHDEGEIVEKQSIVSLAYADGLIYGGTSITGGLGTPVQAKEAELFVWNPETGKKEFETVPVPGATALTCLAIGPDHHLWGIANGTLFWFDTKTQKVISTQKLLNVDYASNHYQVWRDAFMVFHPSGQVFISLDGKLLQFDPAKRAVTVLRNHDVSLLTHDRQGRLYFRQNTDLWQYTPQASF